VQPTSTLADPLGDPADGMGEDRARISPRSVPVTFAGPGAMTGPDVASGDGAAPETQQARVGRPEPAATDPAVIGFPVTEPSTARASRPGQRPLIRCPIIGRVTVGPDVTGRILVAVLLATAQVVGGIAVVPLRPDRPAPGTVLAAALLAGPVVVAVTGLPVVRAVVAVAAADVCLAIGQPVGPVALAAVLCLILAVLAGRHLAAWVVAGAGLAGALVGPRFGPHPVLMSQVMLAAGWVAASLALAEAVRGRRKSAEVWARARAQARLRVAGEQRAEVARDLQDDVAHWFQLATAQAAAGLALLDVDGPAAAADARDALLAIRKAGDDALAELRSASDVLAAPGELVPQTVAPGLAALMALARRWAGTGLVVRAAGDAGPLPPDIDQVAYRVVQEALANVARHSCALHTDVALHRDADLLRLVVSDPGPPRLPTQLPGGSAQPGEPGDPKGLAGLDLGSDGPDGPDGPDGTDGTDGTDEIWDGPTAGRGLTRLRERVEGLGGALSAGPDGAGWSVHVVLPVGPVG
jgi:signal transduction histidine kinase